MTLSKQALFKRLMNEAGDEGSDTGGTDTSEAQGEAQAIEEGAAPAEPDEVEITIGDAAPETADDEDDSGPLPLRIAHKAAKKEAKELRRQLEELKAKTAPTMGAEAAPTVGDRPKLEDFEFDSDAHDKAVDAWHVQKGKVEAHAAKQLQEREKQETEWNGKLTQYAEQKQALKVPDYDQAEEEALRHLSPIQQGMIVGGAVDKAKLIYVLGRNPAKAKELAAMKDPVAFAFAAGRLEGSLKTTPKTTPPVERKLGGSSAGGSGDSIKDSLERLREKAAKTNDYTEVRAFRKKHNV